ncbi:MAG: histidine phosphatase family protein [Acidimicrobiales bacterium]
MTGPDPESLNPERVPPPGVRTTGAASGRPTRVVLVRHGEAVCNAEGVVGGVRGCTGLTELGVRQVDALAERLARTGELAGVAALYSSVLPRAVQTARILAPALERWREGPPLEPVEDCDLCELHPGQADGLTWPEFAERFEVPDWDADPDQVLAPGAESWRGFTARAAAGVTALADAHPGQLVLAACHAGVIEATMVHFVPVRPIRLGLRTEHASMTEWERQGDGWLLRRYNDATPIGDARFTG